MYNYNINRRKFLGLIGCCTCGLIIPSCTTAPITQRRQLKILPESYINRQAFQMYQRVKNSKDIKISNDKKTLSEIREIGKNIEESVSAYFDSIDKPDPTFNFQWEYILIDNEKIKKLNKQLEQINIKMILKDKNKNEIKDKTVKGIKIRFQLVKGFPSKELKFLIDQGKKHINDSQNIAS